MTSAIRGAIEGAVVAAVTILDDAPDEQVPAVTPDGERIVEFAIKRPVQDRGLLAGAQAKDPPIPGAR